MGWKEIVAIKAKKKKVNKYIPKRTKKMSKTFDSLRKLYPIFLSTRPFCKIKSPVCTYLATVVNHTEGRGEDKILDMRTWEESCAPCNIYIEVHDKWARENGHKINRIK